MIGLFSIKEQNNQEQEHQVKHVVSSLPLSLTIHLLDPPAPKEILDISNSLKFRNIILLAFFKLKLTFFLKLLIWHVEL